MKKVKQKLLAEYIKLIGIILLIGVSFIIYNTGREIDSFLLELVGTILILYITKKYWDTLKKIDIVSMVLRNLKTLHKVIEETPSHPDICDECGANRATEDMKEIDGWYTCKECQELNNEPINTDEDESSEINI